VEGTSPYVAQWYENGAPIPGADALTYTIPQATLGLDGAIYTVSVRNTLSVATSRAAVLHIMLDLDAPVVQSVQAPTGSLLRLSFDELLDPNSAAIAGNYRINAGAVPVAAVTLEPDGRTVALTLAARVTGAFTVSISGVRDLAGNTIAAGTTVAGTVRVQALLIDFGAAATTTANGPAPDDPDRFWNNVTDSLGATVGGQLPDLVTTDNTPTGIGLVIVSRFNGANTNGTLASAFLPPDATRDSLFGNTETFSGLSNVRPSFKLTGLDRLRTYDFTFYASRLGVGDNRETGYMVFGANADAATLNAAGNIDQVAVVTGIAPDSAGEITIRLAPGAANNNANHFTYLGALKIEPR